MEKIIRIQIAEELNMKSVEWVLLHELHLTRHQIRSAKYRPNGILVNKEKAYTSRTVRSGDLLEVHLEDSCKVSAQLIPVCGELDISYEDEDLILVNKPAGLVVHPAHGHYDDTLANRLKHYFDTKGTPACIRAIGRLDKDTSGLVLFARNQVAAARLSENPGMVKKEYLALVKGILNPKCGTIEKGIAPVKGELNKMEVSGKGRPAKTCYQVEKEFSDASLVRLTLATGRTHQIRVHMASLYHPLLGDALYGTVSPSEALQRAALHCSTMHLIQPFTGEKLCITASLPEDIQQFISTQESLQNR